MKTVCMNQPATASLSPQPNAVRTTRRFTPCSFIASMQYFVPREK